MLNHTDLRPGTRFILNNEPYEVLSAMPVKMAQRRPVVQTRIKNLINGNVYDRNFQQGDVFDEAELSKINVKFLYSRRGNPEHSNHGLSARPSTKSNLVLWYFFCEKNDPSKRFSFTEEKIGPAAKFLRANEIMDGIVFEDKIINVSIPIKVQLKVKEATPGIKGDSAQGGTKTVILENGTEITVPLFIEEGNILEVNTEEGKYVRRVDKE